MSRIPLPPSDRQHVLAHGEQRAVITQVGAVLREYTVRGVPVLDGFDIADRAADGGGQVLAPWPNRLAGGRYEFGDESFPYLMVYTSDQVGRPERRRRGVAIEPMTCPPNALRSGVSLIALAPGPAWSGQWGLRATGQTVPRSSPRMRPPSWEDAGVINDVTSGSAG